MNDNVISFTRVHTKVTVASGLTTVEYDVDGPITFLIRKFGTEFLSWAVNGPHTWRKYND